MVNRAIFTAAREKFPVEIRSDSVRYKREFHARKDVGTSRDPLNAS
jgi:hypothetical protein